MADNEKSRPNNGTASDYGNDCESKGSINSAILGDCRFDSSKLSKFIIVPITAARSQCIMGQITALYLGSLIDGVRETKAKSEELAIEIVSKYLSVEDAEYLPEKYKDYRAIMEESAGVPRGSIPVKMYECFRSAKGNDLLPLLMYMAIRSIIGKKQFARTTYGMITARMAGYSSRKDKYFQANEITELSSYRLRRIREYLEEYWGLKSYDNKTRCLYMTFSLTFRELVKCVEVKRPSSNHFTISANKRHEEEQVFMELYGMSRADYLAEQKRKRKERSERKAEKEQEAKEPVPNEPEESPKNEPMPETEPKEEPSRSNPSLLETEWLATAYEIQGDLPMLAELMKRSIPTIEGDEAIVLADNQKQGEWLETSETFVNKWEKITKAAKMPNLILKTIVREQEREQELEDEWKDEWEDDDLVF